MSVEQVTEPNLKNSDIKLTSPPPVKGTVEKRVTVAAPLS